MHDQSTHAEQDARTAYLTPANRAWYDERTTAQLRHELRGARKALRLALPYRSTDLRARIVCDSNEAAIPMLEALLEERS